MAAQSKTGTSVSLSESVSVSVSASESESVSESVSVSASVSDGSPNDCWGRESRPSVTQEARRRAGHIAPQYDPGFPTAPATISNKRDSDDRYRLPGRRRRRRGGGVHPRDAH